MRLSLPEAGPGSVPASTQVVIGGGGPVGLATAIELGRRGIHCVVLEPRATVSRARPRCKTINVRTMEHLRRWGIADRLRELAPLPADWSNDIVFCTTLAGRELSRFHGVLGLVPDGDRFPECGQQALQYVLEELLREVAGGLETVLFITGARVSEVTQDDDGVAVTVTTGGGDSAVTTADFVVGADGPRSAVREAIGSTYIGEHALRPNYGMVFSAPRLWDDVAHGPAVQYWIVNPTAPALMGPIDRDGTWWTIAFGVDRETGDRDGLDLIESMVGRPVEATLLSTDPWTARMQLVDRARNGRVFLVGDAAHLNPPFGGHGLNTGIGDAVDLGWKLAAVLEGWGGPGLLASYESERRPIQTKVIAAAAANMRTLATDLLADDIDADGPSGERARHRADGEIQATKHAEFHALDLVLDLGYDASPVVVAGDDTPRPGALPGYRLPHAWIGPERSIFDLLGPSLTLLMVDSIDAPVGPFVEAARQRAIPVEVLRVPDPRLRQRWQAGCVLVRPDQHVAWTGDQLPADPGALLDRVRGAH